MEREGIGHPATKDMMKPLTTTLALTLALGLTACSNLVQVKIDVVDQRTALQNQVLGSYQRLEGDVALLASVRSIDDEGKLVEPPPLPESKRKALRAMRRSLYNRDDIDRLKEEGVMGENNRGYLSLREEKAPPTTTKEGAFVRALVTQENDDRHALYTRVAEENEDFSVEALGDVERIMAGLNRDSALPGSPIQQDDGSWIIKERGKKR